MNEEKQPEPAAPASAPSGAPGKGGIIAGVLGVVVAVVAIGIAAAQVGKVDELGRELQDLKVKTDGQAKDVKESRDGLRAAIERIDHLKVDHEAQLAAAREATAKLRSEGEAELEAVNAELAALRKKADTLAASLKKTRGEPIRLFNGKDLTGWEGVGGELINWTVEDGMLVCKGGKGAKWISTKEQFSDFDLSLDFRIPEGGNSGVFIRTGREGNPAYAGMEIQVIDDLGYEKAHNYKLKPAQHTGSIYSVVAPAKEMAKKAGEWSQMRIRCDGGLVQVWFNGEMIVNSDMDGYDKLRKRPRKGYIGLQNHGSRLEYRNIILRPLN